MGGNRKSFHNRKIHKRAQYVFEYICIHMHILYTQHHNTYIINREEKRVYLHKIAQQFNKFTPDDDGTLVGGTRKTKTILPSSM